MEKENVPDRNEKEELLKSYITRLSKGEELETVREEFKANFSDVSAVDIAHAEQSLLNEGTPLKEVQRLCDIHAALFHGATTAEKIANAEKEVDRSAAEEETRRLVSGFDREIAEQTGQAIGQTGHPLQVLTIENQAILHLLDKIDMQRKTEQEMSQLLPLLQKLATIAQHYGKKDELFFPLLSDKYGYAGPSDVMWGVEDEIRDSLRQILADPEASDAQERLTAVIGRIREMVYKEKNILFPLSIANFTEEEWKAIAADMPMFGPCLIPSIPLWADAGSKSENGKKETSISENEKTGERNTEEGQSAKEDKVVLPGGSMSLEQLRAVLNTLPMEISVIDEQNINRFFNEGEKLFTRPKMAIGRKVFSCHPKRVEPMVRLLLHDFRTGERNSMHILSEKSGRKVLIHYYALRGEDGTYLGTMEAVQEMDEIADALKYMKKGPVSLTR